MYKKVMRNNSTKKWYVLVIIAILILFGSVIAFNIVKQHILANVFSKLPAPVIPVTTLTIKPSPWHQFIDTVGFIQPEKGVTISNQQAGEIKNIYFESGQYVTKETLLVTLDSSVERANLKSTESELPALKNKLKRANKLFQSKAVSKEYLDNTQADYNNLLARIQGLKATIQRRQIKAPFDGTLGLKNIYPGQYLAAGSSIVHLENKQVMQVQFTLSQSKIGKIKVGMITEIRVPSYPNTVFKGHITAISPRINQANGGVNIQASVSNNQGQLLSGMYAKVKVRLPDIPNQIAIPVRAVNFQVYGTTVFTVHTEHRSKDKTPHKTVQITSIKVKAFDDNHAWITEGLKEGDEIITSGQDRLANGSFIKKIADNSLKKPAHIPRL